MNKVTLPVRSRIVASRSDGMELADHGEPALGSVLGTGRLLTVAADAGYGGGQRRAFLRPPKVPAQMSDPGQTSSIRMVDSRRATKSPQPRRTRSRPSVIPTGGRGPGPGPEPVSGVEIAATWLVGVGVDVGMGVDVVHVGVGRVALAVNTSAPCVSPSADP